MSTQLETKAKASSQSTPSFIPVRANLLQRKCACGGTPGPTGECAGCRRKRLQRHSNGQAKPSTVPPIVNEVLRSPGQSLDANTRASVEPRFGHDFSRVRVHTDARAARSAKAVGALAYAVGQNVVFGAGQYSPHTLQGRKLLAHELTHVAQQSSGTHTTDSAHGVAERLDSPQESWAEDEAHRTAERVVSGAMAVREVSSIAGSGLLQRQQLGARVTHPAGSKSSYRRIQVTFDGAEFVVFGDGTELMRVSAQSGRPYSVRPADARACGGSTDDSYLNNPRYVGIRDNGPIPEGTYQFRATEMTTFSAAEQAQMLLGGSYTDPFGRSLHGGDWGAGRVALRPVRVLPSRHCGNTAARSGFYLHGGIMPGSSGCIDIGNSAFSRLVTLLEGYRATVQVTVAYTRPAPNVGAIDRALGRFTYPEGENPTITDRLRSVFGL